MNASRRNIGEGEVVTNQGKDEYFRALLKADILNALGTHQVFYQVALDPQTTDTVTVYGVTATDRTTGKPSSDLTHFWGAEADPLVESAVDDAIAIAKRKLGKDDLTYDEMLGVSTIGPGVMDVVSLEQ